MLEPESYFDLDLASRLLPMVRFKPEFIAVIGYSFAWTGQHYDDAVSLDCFIYHYREFRGPVFVVEPRPERLQEMLAERLHLARVVAIPARWNLLAHAFLEVLAGRLQGVTFGDYCSALYDRGFGDQAYPASPPSPSHKPLLSSGSGISALRRPASARGRVSPHQGAARYLPRARVLRRAERLGFHDRRTISIPICLGGTNMHRNLRVRCERSMIVTI